MYNSQEPHGEKQRMEVSVTDEGGKPHINSGIVQTKLQANMSWEMNPIHNKS